MRAHKTLVMSWVLIGLLASAARSQQSASLSPAETEKLRNTQDPGARIKVYLHLMQKRLMVFDQYRARPVDPQYRVGKFLNEELGQYIDLDDELKSWIQFQYNRERDMRGGLRALLDRAPRQLQQLERAKQHPDPYYAKYSDSLDNAVADLEDTLNGATSALSHQEKRFGMWVGNKKEAKKATNDEIKQEKKRIKEEEKLRKKEEKKGQNPNQP